MARNLKARILIPLMITTTLVLSAIIIGVYQEEKQHIQQEFQQHVSSLQDYYQYSLEENTHTLEATLSILINDNSLKQIFKSKNRKLLLEKTQPIFEQLRTEHDITHFYFHDINSVNFLRVHQPERYGDLIDRFTMINAKQNQTFSHGVELGPLGTFTLRSVTPVYDGVELLGYIELGEEIDHIIKKMHHIFKTELILVIQKQYLNQEKWIAGMDMLDRKISWDQFDTSVLVTQTTELPDTLVTLLQQPLSQYPSSPVDITYQNKQYKNQFMPLVDAGDRSVGHMIVLSDVTARVQKNYRSLFIITGIVLTIGTILFGFFYRVLDHTEREIHGQNYISRKIKSLAKDNNISRRPLFLLLSTLIITTFLAEVVIMLLLPEALPSVWAAIIDGFILVVILHPTLYFLVLRPTSEHIENRIKAENISSHLGRILDQSTDEIYMFDANSLKFIEASAGALENLGYTMDELSNMTPCDLKPEITQEEFYQLIEPLHLGNTKKIHFETVHQRKDGSTYPIEVGLQLSLNEQPPVYVAIVQDISERKQYLAELEHKALYDALTELPNRALLQDRLKQSIHISQRDGKPLAIAVLSTARLKEVNDLLGHDNGDLVLKEMAQRLKDGLRKTDTIARISGDEFAILLPEINNQLIPVISKKIHHLFQNPVIIENNPLAIEIHIGFSIYPEHETQPGKLLQYADIARGVCKHQNMAYSIYNPDTVPYSLRNLKLLSELRQALHDQKLELYYQPKIDGQSNIITSVEALARWFHPVEGMIPPDEFIPLIEHSGLIRPFTLWVLKQAIQQCRIWQDMGIDLKVAVNLSTRNLIDISLPDEINRLLQQYQVKASYIKIEITETAIMSSSETTMSILSMLDAMGLEISIDDFGTGYSSLVHLKNLPVNELKIDRSFIMELDTNKNDLVIVHSMIDLARNLGLCVVAEGVETKTIWDQLVKLGCTTGQGYYFSRPIPAIELTEWVKNSVWGGTNQVKNKTA